MTKNDTFGNDRLTLWVANANQVNTQVEQHYELIVITNIDKWHSHY